MGSQRCRTSVLRIAILWFWGLCLAGCGGGGGTSTPPPTQPQQPGLVLSATSLSFGSQRVQKTTTATINATNSGNATLSISDVTIAGSQASDFTLLSPKTLTVAPGQSTTVQISFTPSAEGQRSASVSVASNVSGGPSTFTLTGTGTLPKLTVSPGTISFPSTLPGTSSSPIPVTINSTGSEPLVITGLALTGVNSAEYTISAGALPLTVPVGQSTVAQLSFTPNGSGARTASLDVSYDGMAAPAVVNLSGNSPDLTQDSRASVLLTPNTAQSNSTVDVQIAGDFTNFVQGATTANFGPGIAISGAAEGVSAPVAVNNQNSATVQVKVQPNVAPGPHVVTVTTGAHESATTFYVTSSTPGPIALAGPPLLAQVGAIIHLDGSRSTDTQISQLAANRLATSGDPLLTYQWSLTSVPAGSSAAIVPPNAVDPSFQIDVPGDYVVKLVVSNGQTSTSSSVIISTEHASPVAVAGKSQHVVVGAKVVLDGSGSYDPDPVSLGYSWKFLSAPASSAASLVDATTVAPSFTADAAGTYVLELTVNDGHGNNSSDQVTITTGKTAPIANAGVNQAGVIGTAVQLDGSKSYDPDGDSLTYQWYFISKPATSSAVLINSADPKPTFTIDAAGTYVLQLVVLDSDLKTSSATVKVSTGTLLPLAIPGDPRKIGLGKTVQLDGSASVSYNQNSLSYQWTLLTSPAGSTAVLTGANSAKPTFVADKSGVYVAQLIVSDGFMSSVPATTTVTGVVAGLSVSPSTLDFGPLFVGTTSVSKTINITSIGSSSVQIDSLGLFGSNSGDFAFSAPALPITLAPDAQTQVTVTFTPGAAGARTATLKTSDDSVDGPHAVTLLGSGTLPAFNAAPPSLSFGSQLVGTSQKKTLGIQNNGTADLTITALAVTGINALDFTVTNAPLPLTIPAGSTANLDVSFVAGGLGNRVATLVFTDNAPDSPQTLALSGIGIGPAIQISLSTVDFGNQLLNTPSTPKALTVTNNGTADLTISAITKSGAQAAEFSFTAPPTPITLAPGTNASFPVTFNPGALGSRSASLNIAHNAPGSPATIIFSGNGVSPVISVSPVSVTFPDQLVGVKSAQIPIQISNTGTADLVVSQLSISGTNSSDFAFTSGSLPITIAAGTQAVVNVTFTPSAKGARAASLAISHNAVGSPQSISLAGNGLAPLISISPSSLDLGSILLTHSSAQTPITLTNTGTADLVISNLAISGPNAVDFAFTASARPITVLAGGNTVVNVTFAPSALGSRSATLTVTDNVAGGPHTVALSGTGTAPAIGVAPSPVTFANQLVGTTSAATTVTVSNTGTADLVISAITLGGTNAANFALTAPATPVTIAAGTNKTFSLTFSPSATGVRSATVTVTHNATGSPTSLAVTGTGIAPGVSLDNISLSYGNQLINTGVQKSVKITNSGTADLVISDLAVSGANASEFTISAAARPITVVAGGNTTVSVTFTPTAVGSRTATLSISDNATGSPQTVALSGTGAAPGISVSPASLAFSDQLVGTTSAAKLITISNNGTADLVISGIALSGANTVDFAITAPATPVTIAAGTNKTISFTFTPSAVGARSASLTLTHNASGSPQSVNITGNGIAPAVTLDNTSLSYGNQLINTGVQKSVKITNSGTANLVISNLAVSGANASEFVLSASPTPITVAPGANTTVNVTFTPVATGGRSAILTITDNATGSPRTVALAGTGIAPGIDLSPASVSFANQAVGTTSAAMPVSIKNTGTADLVISNVALNGANASDFAITAPSTPLTLAPNATTTVSLTFTPSAIGLRSATVTLTHNATGSPQSISINGTGTAPTATLDATSLSYGNQLINTGVQKTVTITNNGNSNLVISDVAITGANAADFAFTAATRPITVTPNATATVTVTFTPSAVGSRAATLSITDNAANSPQMVSLSGTGTAPAINVTPTSVTFANQLTGTTSAVTPVAIKNTGTADLVISNLAISGTNASEFAFTAATRPITVAPNATTTVNLTFAPSTTGSRSATLNITDNAGGPHSVALSGTGIAPAINLAPSPVTFANQLVGTTSTVTTVTVNNTGTADLVISNIALGGANAADFAMTASATPLTIAPNASSTISLTFTPSATGSRSAAVTLTDNVAGGPHIIAITGTGIAPGIQITPTSVPFANQLISTTSAATPVTIKNTGSADLVISNLAITGADAAQFAFSAGTTPVSLAPNATTTVNVTFSPATTGSKSAALTITHNGAASPQNVALTGTGVAPAISLTPTSVTFANQLQGTTSASKTISVQNTGTADLVISAISLAGANAGDFAMTAPTTPLTIAPNASSTITLTFTPSATGSRNAAITLTHNASGSSSAISITGSGIAPAVTLDNTSLSYANQLVNTTTQKTVQITNSGTADLVISNVAITGANAADFGFTAGTRPITVAPNASTTVTVTFTPATSGSKSATLAITDNAGGPHTVSLSGTGIAPVIDISPAGVSFAGQLAGSTSAVTPVTIKNTGTADLVISTLSVSGAQSADFAFTAPTLPITVIAGAQTTINLTFTPIAVGTRTATLNVADNAGGPHTIALSGTGIAPAIDISPASVTFANQLTGTTSTAKTITITNTGTADLVISNIALGGTNAVDFALTAPATPLTVAAGNSATLSLTFTPSATSARNATITLTDNAAGSPHTISITGSGIAPAIQITPASVPFANQLQGTTSAATPVAIKNTGSADLVIGNLTITGTDAAQFAFTSGTTPITVAPNATTTVNVTFSPAATGAKSATLAITDNAGGSPHSVALTGTGVAPAISLTPASVTFANQLQGTTSAAKTITVQNTGSSDLVVSNIALSGTNAADFAMTAPTTPLTIAPNASSTITLTFTPSATGTRNATITLTHNATGSPSTISISGSGIAPALTLDNTSLAYGSQLTGTSVQKTVQITNTGSADLVISNLAITGANASEFSFTAAARPITLVANTSTSVTVTFTPTTNGAKSANLSITDNVTGSPHTVSLSGSGIAPAIDIAPTSVTFANQLIGTTSSAKTVTIQNTGTADLVISNITLGGTNAADFALTAPATPLTIAAGNGATLSLTFTPAATGARTATVTLTDNVTGSPQTIAVTGGGIAPSASLDNTSLSYGNQLISTSVQKTVTVTNNGTADLVISNLTITGSDAADYTFTAAARPITITPGANTTITVTFTPTTTGAKAATLTITDNAAGSPHSVALTGTGVAPAISLTPASVTFANQLIATASAVTPVTIKNTGSADLVISNLAISGTNAADFAFTAAVRPITLNPNATTTVNLTFAPATVGPKLATLTITDNAGGSPHAVALTGTGVAPAISITPSPVAFGNQLVGTTSAATTVTVQNTGTADLTISNIALGGTNGADFILTAPTTPLTVTAGNSATLTVKFAPNATGNRSGTLTFTDNAAGSPHTINLTGTGIAPAIDITPTPVTFANQLVSSTSAATTVTLKNTGTADLVISSITLGGANAADFAMNAPATPVTITAGATKTLTLTFTPSAAGARVATISFSHNAGGSPSIVAVNGTGIIPGIEIAPSPITFANQLLNTASAQLPVTITNTGSADLVISDLAITGANAADFMFSAPARPITVPGGNTTTINVTFTPSSMGTRSATLAVTDNVSGSPHTVALSGNGVAPAIDLNPTPLTFANQPVGTSSAASTVTVKNTGTSELVISSITLGGSNAADFALTAPATPLTIAAGNTATLSFVFTPAAVGSRTATLTFSDNVAGSPQVLSISGTGIAPAIDISPASVTFASQLANTISAITPLTIKNTGTANLVISNLSITGADSSQFAFTAAARPITVAPNATTAINLTFTPTSTGVKSAALSITDNAGGPHSVALTGSGIAPAIDITPASITFANQLIGTTSAAKTFTVSNSGTADLVISNITLGGTNAADFALTAPVTPVTIAAGNSATLSLTFTPSATGARNATITLTDNVTGSPHSIAVSGSGIAPAIQITPASVPFANQLQGTTSAATPIIIKNTGTADLVISSLTITGTDAAQFAFTSGTTPITVAPNATTTVNVTFSPATTGAKSASLSITDNAGGPHSVALTGSGVAPAISVTPTSATFANQLQGTTSASKTITVQNTGTSDLVISTIALGGANAADYAMTAPITPLTIAPNASSTITLTFTPSATGTRNATITLTHNATVSPSTIAISGTGIAPAIQITPTSLTFSSELLNSTSAASPVTIKNTGTADLTISNLTITGLNAAEFGFTSPTLPQTIAPNATITVNVTFTPAAVGSRTATLNVADNAGGPHTLALTGTGIAPAIDITPTSVTFVNQLTGTTSAAKTVTIQNTGTADLVISNITLGGTNAADFALTAPATPLTIATGNSATLSLTFTPSATGARNATITLTDNVTGSPHSISVTGSGIAPAIQITPASVPFANQLQGTTSAATPIAIKNTGSADLVISSLAITGTDAAQFAFTSGATPITVAPNATTTVNVTFSPATTGAKSASLNITDNAGGSPHSVALTGTGVAPAISVTPTSVTFANQLQGTTSASKTITVQNTGTSDLVISNIALGGSNAADYAMTAPTTPLTIAAGNSATLSVTFTPSATGARTATITLTHNATGSSTAISISGSGIAPAITLDNSSLAYGSQLTNTSTQKTVQITNTGSADLVISNLALSGANAGEFSFTAAARPITLAPNAGTSVTVTFTPTTTGAKAASLSITDTATGSPHTVALSGTGVAPGIQITPSPVTFANQQVGTTSSASTVTVKNTGTADLVISNIVLGGASAADFALTAPATPVTITAGNTATLSLTFTPSASGTRNATITLTDNVAGSPQVISVSGLGLAAGASLDNTSLAYGNQLVNNSSQKTVTITNNGNADLVISNIAISGANAADYSFSAATRPITVTAGTNTTVTVTFAPTSTGSRTATLSITDNATGSPQTVSLSGTGVAPAITITPSSATFANQLVGTASAATPLTIKNTGTADLLISNLAISGTNAADFAFTAGTLPITVTANSTTTVNVTFSPSATGSRAATLSVTDNVGGSPQTVVLTGTGIAPAISITPTPVTFANQLVGSTSAATTITVQNTGTADLVISNIALGGTNSADFILTAPATPLTILAGNSATLTVKFAPNATGNRSGTLTFTDNVAGSPHAINISGTGIAPAIDIQPPSVTFASRLVGTTSAATPIALKNTGTADLVISNLAISGANLADFAFSAGTLPITVTPGSTTTVNVTFSPSATGNRSASLVVTDSAPGSPQVVGLSGLGTSPQISITPVTVSFPNQLVGSSSVAIPVSLQNSGTADLVVSSITLGGTASADYSMSSPATPLTIVAGGSATVSLTFTPSTTGSRPATLTVAHNAAGSPSTVNISGTGIAPAVSLDNSSLSFGNQLINTGAQKTVTVTNNGTADLTITNLAVSGANAADFGFLTSPRPITVAPGANTVITVAFIPSATGSRSATLNITDNAAGSPHAVSLSGTGTAPAISLTPSPLTFANQLVGSTSTASTVTVKNTGTADLTISSIALGGTNSSNFAMTAPATPLTLAPNATSIISLTFTPSATGARSATVTIADNVAGSPQVVNISGTGIAPAINITPASVTFANQLVGVASSATPITIENTGTADLVISNLTIGGTNASEFGFSAAARPITVAAGASTTVNVTFTPSAPGNRTASLNITDNVSGSPHTVALSGVGIAPAINITPSPVTFADQLVGSTSSSSSITVKNTGTADLVISSISLGGTNSSDFAMTAPATPLTLAPNATGTVSLTFTPSATGSRTATITLNHNATGSPSIINISGNGIAPAISLDHSSLSYGNQLVNTSAQQTVKITNTGTADLVVSNLAISGSDAAMFSFSASARPITVTPGSFTNVTVTFNPTATGARSATLNITDNVSGSPHTVSLTGTGTAPAISVTPNPLPFGNQLVGVASAASTVTIQNTGTADLVISTITLGGTNAADFALTAPTTPLTIVAGNSATLSLTFTPSATGSRAATIALNHNATGSPATINISGTGVAPTANVTPANISFPNTAVGTSSTNVPVTISNTGTADLTISAVTITGTNAGEFAFTAGTLPITVAANTSTTVNVRFSPVQFPAGSRSATLTIVHNASGSPSTVALTGTSQAPTASVSPSSLSFGQQALSTSSAAKTVTVTNNGTADLVISSVTFTGTAAADYSTTATFPMTITPGTNNTIGVVFAPTATGTRIAAMKINDNAANSPQTVNVAGQGITRGTLSMPTLTIGKDLEELATVSISTSLTSDLSITVTSLDPSRVLLSKDASLAGTSSVTLTVLAGQTISFDGLYIQALDSGSSPQLKVTAQGYSDIFTTVVETPSGFVLSGPSGASFNTIAASDVTMRVDSYRLDGNVPAEIQKVRGGLNPTVLVTTDNGSIGTIVGSPVSMPGGTSEVVLTFHPLALGSTFIGLATPSGFTTPSAGTGMTANVIAPAVHLNPSVVGYNLEVTSVGTLETPAGTGGVPVTITSNDSNVLLSTDSLQQGTSSVVVTVPAGSSTLPTFYIQSLGSTGEAVLTASAPGYSSTTAAVAMNPSGFVIAGPSGTIGEDFSTTPASNVSQLTVSVMQLDSAFNPVRVGTIRGGLNVGELTIDSSDGNAGLVFGNPNFVAGSSIDNTAVFFPFSLGSTVLSVEQPAGFSTPVSGGQLTALVTTPTISLNLQTSKVGKNLQIGGFGSLNTDTVSDLSVTITSNNPSVLLSTSPTTAGSSSITVTVPSGKGGRGIGFPSFYIQSTASSGSATLTASATDWTSGSTTVNLAPSGFVISGPNGYGAAFATLTTSNDSTITVSAVQLNSSTLAPEAFQPVRGGASVNLSVTSGTPSVGTIVESSSTFNGNDFNKTVHFHPLSVGTTLLSVPAPGGFSTPASNGSLSATVN